MCQEMMIPVLPGIVQAVTTKIVYTDTKEITDTRAVTTERAIGKGGIKLTNRLKELLENLLREAE